MWIAAHHLPCRHGLVLSGPALVHTWIVGGWDDPGRAACREVRKGYATTMPNVPTETAVTCCSNGRSNGGTSSKQEKEEGRLQYSALFPTRHLGVLCNLALLYCLCRCFCTVYVAVWRANTTIYPATAAVAAAESECWMLSPLLVSRVYWTHWHRKSSWSLWEKLCSVCFQECSWYSAFKTNYLWNRPQKGHSWEKYDSSSVTIEPHSEGTISRRYFPQHPNEYSATATILFYRIQKSVTRKWIVHAILWITRTALGHGKN